MSTRHLAGGEREQALADGLLIHLLKDFAPLVALAGDLHRGVAEQAGTPVIGALETALAAEAMAHPALADRAPGFAREIFVGLAAMNANGDMPRAVGPLPLVVLRDDPRDFDIRTATHRFFGNLFEGVLRQDIRHAEGPGLQHTGNMIEFRLWGRSHCVDVEDCIDEAHIEKAPGGVRLSHVSAIAVPGRFGGARKPVGRLTYTYEIRADDAWLGLQVRFDAASGVRPDRLRLITACDALSEVRPFRQVTVDDEVMPLQPGTMTLRTGSLDTIGLVQQGAEPRWITLRPAAPGVVVNAKLAVREDAAAHWLLLRHASTPGVAVQEARLLLDSAGRDGTQRGRDLSRPRGCGIMLYATAKRLARAADYASRPDQAERSAVEELSARLLASLRADPAIGALDAGFLVLAEIMLGAPPDLATLLRHEQRSMAAPGVELGRYGDAADQAAALLAFVAAEAEEPLARALNALRLVSAPTRIDGLGVFAEFASVDGSTPVRDGFGLALLIRALRALTVASARGRIALEPLLAARALRLRAQYEDLLEARMHPSGEGLALLEASFGGSAHGAAQAAALGVYADSQ